MWSVESGLWSVVCGLMRVVCGVRCVVTEVRPVTICRFQSASKWPISKMTGKSKLPGIVGKFVCLIDCLVSKHLAQYSC